MDSSLVALMMLSLLLGCGCWLLFLWAVRDGQFNDIERPKHRMLDDEEDFSWRTVGGSEREGPGLSETKLPLPSPPPPGEGT